MALRREAELDRKPAGERGVLGDRLDSPAPRRSECDSALPGRRPIGHGHTRPCSWQKTPKGGPMLEAGDTAHLLRTAYEVAPARRLA